VVVENISHGPYTIPPPIGYPARDVAGGDPVVDAVDTKSKGDDDGIFAQPQNTNPSGYSLSLSLSLGRFPVKSTRFCRLHWLPSRCCCYIFPL
ncbi:unnamed protein product, partial [Brassica rapa]